MLGDVLIFILSRNRQRPVSDTCIRPRLRAEGCIKCNRNPAHARMRWKFPASPAGLLLRRESTETSHPSISPDDRKRRQNFQSELPILGLSTSCPFGDTSGKHLSRRTCHSQPRVRIRRPPSRARERGSDSEFTLRSCSSLSSSLVF